ncbi:MAG: hypothetical protein MR750_06090 [Methanobrevibacter boviskoreani]|uniref:hypothetical protein n=1 Tax=Methanobrevibacter boviskoreani TaxID=1348249 RepID=UPI0023A82CB6|nr:hypothetical protein [Methanobrevibacter boviskoreani]MCI6930798.1 hypothetical protein [Methanobrevibacter boviskoreani]
MTAVFSVAASVASFSNSGFFLAALGFNHQITPLHVRMLIIADINTPQSIIYYYVLYVI